MIREQQNLVPVLLAALLHAAILAVMIFAFELPRRSQPATPLAIQASLVTAGQQPVSPPVVEQEPEPEPEPAPPEPDPAELERQEAERQRRQQELEAEQERIREQQAAEQRRLEQEVEERRRREEAERQRLRQEAEERRRREEAELERQRQEAEQRRLEEIERQRRENERRRREAEEAERTRLFEQELAEEEARLAALSSGEMAAYENAIRQKIERNWVRPASAVPGLECVVLVRQVPGGEVIGATIETCNGDAAVRRSIEAAVFKASPLPAPPNPSLFERNLRITFKPEQ